VGEADGADEADDVMYVGALSHLSAAAAIDLAHGRLRCASVSRRPTSVDRGGDHVSTGPIWTLLGRLGVSRLGVSSGVVAAVERLHTLPSRVLECYDQTFGEHGSPLGAAVAVATFSALLAACALCGVLCAFARPWIRRLCNCCSRKEGATSTRAKSPRARRRSSSRQSSTAGGSPRSIQDNIQDNSPRGSRVGVRRVPSNVQSIQDGINASDWDDDTDDVAQNAGRGLVDLAADCSPSPARCGKDGGWRRHAVDSVGGANIHGIAMSTFGEGGGGGGGGEKEARGTGGDGAGGHGATWVKQAPVEEGDEKGGLLGGSDDDDDEE
jgi:hypothetical protein